MVTQENVDLKQYKSLVEEIREKCAENEKNIMERKAEMDDSSVEEEDSIQELKTKSRDLRLSVVDTRKISLTCESPQFQQLDANNHFLGEPKKNGRLRSPAPSPIPSPVSSPSPVRNRFQVSKVVEGQNSCLVNVPEIKKRSSRFKVTVIESKTGSLPNICINRNESAEEPQKCTDERSNVNEEQTCSNEQQKCSDQRQICSDEQRKCSDERQNDQERVMSEDNSVTNEKSEQKLEVRKETCHPITERIRKLSWVSPILQAPAVAMESAKIPANLEKLIGLFQNPFVRNQTKSSAEEARLFSGVSDNESNRCDEVAIQKCDSSSSRPGDAAIPESRKSGCNDFSKLSENFIKKFSEEIKFKEETSNTGVESHAVSAESKLFPATWPQKLSSSCLSSPSKSSPNILEATAFVLLQGQVSSDLAGE